MKIVQVKVSDVYQVMDLIVHYIKSFHYNVLVPVNCQDGDVRLVEGSSAHEGRVEVCIRQRWGTVCHNHWSTSDGQVVCRQLGYSTEGIILCIPFLT